MPEFVAKTQNSSVPDTRFEGFTIPSLKDFTDGDPDEMVLCPVRAVCAYLQRTEPLCSKDQGLSLIHI